MDKREQFSISQRFSFSVSEGVKGEWLITQATWRKFNKQDGGYWSFPHDESGVVWRSPVTVEDETDKAMHPPSCVRAEYECLIEYDPTFDPGSQANIVEMIADEDGGFDQPCRFGNRVDGHAVYCHNSKWLYALRKCRRTWYTGGETRDEDCEGYAPNPHLVQPGK